MSCVTTHVLDAAQGRPAVGVQVTLFAAGGSVIASGSTDADGRIPDLGPDVLTPADYRLVFDTGTWFGDIPNFYPLVTIDFTVTDGAPRYHVPLLLSPFAYTTYRGS